MEIILETDGTSNEDHNYSDLNTSKKKKMENIASLSPKSNFIHKVTQAGKEKFIGLKITNLNDLKRATPRLKLPSILTSSVIKKSEKVSEEVKEILHKYCRTCAGKKVPLVDIFSEKGIQMRLSQQMQHLEDIDKKDSLSTQMCMDCICDLRMSYKFFMQIKKAEMKLQSVCNTLNDSINKSPKENGNELKEAKSVSKPVTSLISETDSNFDENIKEEICETKNEVQDALSETNDSYEEFDPDDLNCTQSDRDQDEELEIDKDQNTKKTLKPVYQYNESLHAYVKVYDNEESEIKIEQNIEKNDNAAKKIIVSSKPVSQTSITPNILKRKLSSGTSDENCENVSKKLSIDLKDIKIPKLNLQNTANIKSEEDGVMYVTAKGSKPNEMLLIKVKKMDKIMDKKADRISGKKKVDSASGHKIYPKYESNNPMGSFIDEQIEEYKKKRVQILGETAILPETNKEVAEIRTTNKQSDNECCDDYEDPKDVIECEKEEGDEISKVIKEMSSIPPHCAVQLEKLKQRWKDSSKNKSDSIDKELPEDCINRLRGILKQKDEYIIDFISYLKQRKIMVSRLKDEDIILLYEAKNNVIIDKSELIQNSEENVDPFELKESYDCDFCDLSFSIRELEFEHAKTHDFKLMHYCEDCKQEFSTHKAKRAHNITCVQKLMCKHCNMILESKGKKRQHEQKHCDEQYGQLCDLCGEKFKHQGTLDQHVKSRHMQLEKIYKCPQCSKRFAFRTKLTFHLKSVHTTCRAYLCEDCGSDFKNPASLRHHKIRKHQAINNKKECTVCHKLVPVYSMSKHMHTHKAYSIQCPHCNKMFKNSSTLKQHVRIHEDQRQYKCDLCGVGFNRRDGLRLHLKVHEKADSRGLKECSCQVCGEKFPNHSMLVIHRNRTHKDGRNYTCHICNRSMISTRSLEWHLSNIHNETMPGIVRDESSIDAETKRVSCYHCDKTFKTEMILRTHIKNTHVKKEPMKCLDCDMMYTSEVRLKHHMMVTHNRTEGTLVCPHCPKRFVNQLRLKTHMISHSDERPHTCDLCGFMLKTKIQLIKHKQNRHSNERPLQCKYCSWRCKQVSALVCHERTHTNERPYSCSVCKQKFKYLGDKNKHERRHESLGGTGFKRIVTKRSANKASKHNDNTTDQDSDQEHFEFETEQDVDEDFEEPTEESVECYETKIIKFNDDEIIAEGSEAPFQQMYVEDTSQDTNDTSRVVIGMEETTVYTEEVTADPVETQVITDNIINEHMLQPGTVVHLQQEDETGKIQVIPVMLSLPDLSDATNEVGLTTASIIYN